MSEVKLLPCPFCGSNVNDDSSGHTESCYFTAQENFENSCGGDISVVLDAWNTRPDFDAQRLRADTAKAERDSAKAESKALAELDDVTIAKLGNRLKAAEQRIAEQHALLLRCKEVFDNCCGMSDQKTRVDWYANYLVPTKVDLNAALNPNSEAESHEVAREALKMENQRITPARFKCLACGDYHEGSGNLPCPKTIPYAGA